MRWADIREDWLARPGFSDALEREFPYRDVSLTLNGLRADMDLTQTEFAQLVGMPQSTIARLESGRHNPSVRILKQLAQATGAELIIEFRRPKRKRRAKAGEGASSSGRSPRTDKSLAASSADD